MVSWRRIIQTSSGSRPPGGLSRTMTTDAAGRGTAGADDGSGMRPILYATEAVMDVVNLARRRDGDRERTVVDLERM
jgi:hypothetical protein